VVAGSLSGFVLALVDQVLNIELSIARRVAAFAVSLVIELVGVTRGKIVGPTVLMVSIGTLITFGVPAADRGRRTGDTPRGNPRR